MPTPVQNNEKPEKKQEQSFSDTEKVEILAFLQQNMCVKPTRLDLTAWQE